ncbi:hypothetical protein SAZ11_07775 [Streptomyces sp. FXJ1.4098]|nr:hypothetical protein [Streptomyces sp. FXJ1.4098]
MVTTTPSALSTAPGDAGPGVVADVLAALAGAAAEFFDRWDRARAEKVLQLAGWLQCAAAWRTQDLHEPPGVPGPAHVCVVHGLITAYQGMLARQRAEIAVFMYADGTLKGEDYNDHDAVFAERAGQLSPLQNKQGSPSDGDPCFVTPSCSPPHPQHPTARKRKRSTLIMTKPTNPYATPTRTSCAKRPSTSSWCPTMTVSTAICGSKSPAPACGPGTSPPGRGTWPPPARTTGTPTS